MSEQVDGGTEQPKILVLEDDPSLRETLAKMLVKRGYRVDVAASGQEAVEAAVNSTYDLIVTDIRMEGMDGLDALEKVKESQPDIASLVITGYSTEEDSIRAIRLGVGEYLKKPFRLPTLFESVGQILSKREKKRVDTSLAGSVFAVLEGLLKHLGSLSTAEQSKSGESAHELALRLGLDKTQANWVRLAVLAKLTEGLGVDQLEQRLPERLCDLLQSVDQPWADITLEARIVAAVLKIHTSSEDYDPDVITALHSHGDSGRLSTKQQSGLLTVAEALANRGQFEGAKQALERLSEGDRCNRTVVEALRRMSELCASQGETEAGLDYAHRALDTASRLGPRSHAQSLLKMAVLWASSHPELAQNWLDQGQALAQRVQDDALLVSNQLAAVHFGFSSQQVWEHLPVLLQARHSRELTEGLNWLIPLLLNESDERSEDVLHAWFSDFGPLFSGLVNRRRLSSAQLFRLLDVMLACGGPEAIAITERLLSQEDTEVSSKAADTLAKLSSVQQGSASVRIVSLGKFQVFRGLQESKNWKTQKVRYLFAYLVANLDKPVTDDELLEAFWPDSVPQKGKKSLNTALSFLRSHLKKTMSLEDVVCRDPSGITLNPELNIWHDMMEFQKEAATAAKLHKTQDPKLELSLRTLLDLYGGPYLEGCFMPWAVDRRYQLERYARDASARLTQYYFHKNQPEETIEVGLRALELDPCQEQAALLLLKSYLKLGRREEALRFSKEFTEHMDQELGLPPSEEFLGALEL